MVVIVTGGCGLIGSAFVRALVERGDAVVVADVDEDTGAQLVDELGDSNVLFQRCDITRPPNVDTAFKRGSERFGRVDALVHAAYPRTKGWGTPFEELDADDVAANLNLQLGSSIMVSQRAVRYFKEQGHGHLVHIASIQGMAAPKFNHYEGTSMTSPIAYTAIKSGVIGITRYLAKYLKGTGLRVNCLSPGGILDAQPESFLERYRASCTTKGMLDAEDLTGALLFLLSEQSTYVNGHNLVVDDGWSL
jgi:NAD(P)-dependent dehydrogenase (short-subunit alcohol dehydrogenase family)